MSEASNQVSAAASQVSSASQSLAEGTSEQASSIEETSSSLEELSSMTKQNADNAGQADSLMSQSMHIVQRANDYPERSDPLHEGNFGRQLGDIQDHQDH